MGILERIFSSRCGWRFTVYGLLMLAAGFLAGYALGYRQGWENALRTVLAH